MELVLIFLLTCFMFVSGMYLIYWLIIEMPVLLKIKHEELYERWRDR
jgi:hypothetical protein